MSTSDPRLTPARDDLAAAHLKGKVQAQRFVEGRSAMAARAIVSLRKAPHADAPQETQLLHGERFTIYEEKDGWVWGQCALDSYVGYAKAASFVENDEVPGHRVSAVATPLFSAPDVKKPARATLPMNAKLLVLGRQGNFYAVAGGDHVFAGHVSPLTQPESDFVAVAEKFLGAPYLWGGKTVSGLDCSGLIQTALEACGTAAPRDTDMMEAKLGAAIVYDPSRLKRGDLVFWKGHVGVMRDAENLLHANAFTMDVTSETLSAAAKRIAATGANITSVKRLK